MTTASVPFVSCIMPTYNRREFIPNAIHYFLRQQYAQKELIIIDDGTDNIQDLVPDNPAIRYFYLQDKVSLGAKLNLACQYAKGTVIAHWDDDDWYARQRLEYQVESLQKNKTDVCGINNLLYYDLRNKTAYNYIYPPLARPWLLGSSLCYFKEFWRDNQFADINVGMDALFVWKADCSKITVLADNTFAVHMIHDNNISPKKTAGVWWHPFKAEEIKKLMGVDWFLYRSNRSAISSFQTSMPEAKKTKEVAIPHLLKNIYACLVHENEACIIDLVTNLYFNDPSSTILLYNGSENPYLLGNTFSYEKYGVVVHPKPLPVKYGYLHDAALSCMQFALDNFSFDILTFVDSDQLSIRRGYAGYLSAFFSSLSGVGMLSSNPEQVTRHDNTNRIAAQAFKEFDLWKPLLQMFPGGENKFVHWTFWPSAVFTREAIKDLLKLFRGNEVLQNIVQRTKIWASEEVILPTLVKLLGYHLAANPCSYEFMRYRKSISIQDIEQAMKKEDNYWVHPVTRNIDDPVRKYIRLACNKYCAENRQVEATVPFPGNLSAILPLLNKIEGWLSNAEAQLLFSILKACDTLPAPQNIVEIGSYHGKSTVLFGRLIKELALEAKVYAIDPHDGRLGAADTGIRTFPSSWEPFKKNIAGHFLSGIVEMIRDHSYNVSWKKPISLLFIDGLHDYSNVAKDFSHFAAWILPGGYVAFHDYAVYYPGVKKFVNELLQNGKYYKINLVDSLIVLQKEAA